MLRSFISACHERWANLHPLVRVMVLLALLAGCGFFAVKPAYHAFKDWRVRKNLVDARKAVDDNQMQEARDLSMAVLQAGDPCIEAYRILEKSTASLRDPRHGDVARALISHPDGTDEDRLSGFLGVVMDMPLGVVGQAWNALPPACQTDARFAMAFAGRLIAEKRLNEAASVLLAVPQERRDGPVNRGLVRVLIGSGKWQGLDEAQRLIAVGFPPDGPEVSAWLDLLEELPAVSMQDRLLDPIRKHLENQASGDSARAGLILARMDYATQYSRRAGVLEEAIAKWKDRSPALLARFLNHLGLHRRLLETLPAESVEACPELFPEWLSAAEAAGAWDRVLPLLDAHGHLIPKLEELAHRAVVAAKTNEAPRQTEAWEAAMESAKAEPSNQAFLTIQRIALAAGLKDEAEQALLAAIRTGRGPLPLYSDLKPLLRSLEQKGHEKALLDICVIYLSFEPGNPVLLTQYAYVACLNDVVEPKTVIEAIKPLAKAFPKEFPIHAVLATAYLCDNQPAKAAELLDPFKPDLEKLAPAYRAVVLTTQVLNSRIAKNDPQIEGFPWKSLQISERRKFSELIRSAGL